MNLKYLTDFLNHLTSIRDDAGLDDITFDVANFHHYSAYKINELLELSSILPNDIVTASLNPITYTNNLGILIDNVDLETTVTGDGIVGNKVWIHPELDGYKLRGKILSDGVQNLGINQVWVTEWGYPSITNQEDAQYPEALTASGVIGGGGMATQAKWLMRGFMEYQASKGIDKSFWHWYKDTDNGDWDESCGIVNINENDKKTAWWYLCTLRDQIGDLAFASQHDVDGLGEHFAWSFDATLDTTTNNPNNYIITPQMPPTASPESASAPRIYQYKGAYECSYLDDVWVMWLPTATESSHNKLIYLDSLGIEFDNDPVLNPIEEPTHYSFVIPTVGQCEIEESALMLLEEDDAGNLFLVREITDTPTFIRFYHGKLRSDTGEYEFVGLPENGCPTPPVVDCKLLIAKNDITCHSAIFDLTIGGDNCPSTSVNITNNGPGNISYNNEQIIISDLDANTEYTLDFVVNLGSPTGLIYGQTFSPTVTTAANNCFGEVAILSTSYTGGCTEGLITVELSIEGVTHIGDLDVLSVQYQKNDGIPQTFTVNWINFSGGTITLSIPYETMPDLDPADVYTITILQEDNVLASEVIEVSTSCDDCLDEEMLEPAPVESTSINVNASCDDLEICFLPSNGTICESSGSVNTNYIVEILGDNIGFSSNVTLDNATQGELSCINLGFSSEDVGIGDFQIRIGADNGSFINYSDWITFSNESCCYDGVEISIGKYVSSCWSTKISIDINTPSDCSVYYDFSFDSSYEDCYTEDSQFYPDYPTAASGTDFTFILRHYCLFQQYGPGYPITITIYLMNTDGKVIAQVTETIIINPVWLSGGRACTDIPMPECDCAPDTRPLAEFGRDNGKEGKFVPSIIATSCENNYATVIGNYPEIDNLIKLSSTNREEIYYLLFEPDMDLVRYEKYKGIFDLSIPNPDFDKEGKLSDYLVWMLINDKLMEFSYPEIVCKDFKTTNEDGGGRTKNNFDLSSNNNIVTLGHEDLSIFPNPTDKDLTITLSNANLASIRSIQLLDVQGKKVLDVQDLSTKSYLLKDLENLEGTYFLMIQLSDGSKRFEKIIIH